MLVDHHFLSFYIQNGTDPVHQPFFPPASDDYLMFFRTSTTIVFSPQSNFSENWTLAIQQLQLAHSKLHLYRSTNLIISYQQGEIHNDYLNVKHTKTFRTIFLLTTNLCSAFIILHHSPDKERFRISNKPRPHNFPPTGHTILEIC